MLKCHFAQVVCVASVIEENAVCYVALGLQAYPGSSGYAAILVARNEAVTHF